MTTEERARRLFVDHLGVEAEKVDRNADLIDDLGADSLDKAELIIAFEEEFGIEIADDEAENLFGQNLVGDWINLIDRKLAPQA